MRNTSINNIVWDDDVKDGIFIYLIIVNSDRIMTKQLFPDCYKYLEVAWRLSPYYSDKELCLYYWGLSEKTGYQLMFEDKETFLMEQVERYTIRLSKNELRYCFAIVRKLPISEQYFFFKVSESIVNYVNGLQEIISGCTDDSIKEFFKNYPTTYELLHMRSTGSSKISTSYGSGFVFDYLSMIYSKSDLACKAKEYAQNIDDFIAELSNMRLDTRKLKRIADIPKPTTSSTDSKVAKWVFTALSAAAIITVKFAAKAIGAEIDIPIPTDGNGPDIDIDVDTDVNADFDTGDTPDAYADVDNQHNVSFGKSVSQLETEISNLKKDIRDAESEINYWEYQDSIHSNPSNHYRKSIDIGLKNAGKKYDKATKKLEELMNELQKMKNK